MTSTALVYTLKPTSGFFFFPDGGSINIGGKMQRLTAYSTVEAELMTAITFEKNEVTSFPLQNLVEPQILS